MIKKKFLKNSVLFLFAGICFLGGAENFSAQAVTNETHPAGFSVPPAQHCAPGSPNCCPTHCAPLAVCGDGIVATSEECEDNGILLTPGYTCVDCRRELASTSCGDGIIQSQNFEQCDNGIGNNSNTAACTAACRNARCGDNIVYSGVEACDDGNPTSGDGCSSSCQLENQCGNGVVNSGEQCDDGNTVDGDCCSSCSNTCVCGNGTRESGEACEDGNTTAGDGCSATCQIECGNGTTEGTEACDDHNTVSGDGCSSSCLHEIICGDGAVESGETCDDTNTFSGDGCSSTCLLEQLRIDCGAQITEQNGTFSGSCTVTPAPSNVVWNATIAGSGCTDLSPATGSGSPFSFTATAVGDANDTCTVTVTATSIPMIPVSETLTLTVTD